MIPENFIYWLQGWIDLENPISIHPAQLKLIQTRLDAVLMTRKLLRVGDVEERSPEAACLWLRVFLGVSNPAEIMQDIRNVLEGTILSTDTRSIFENGNSSYPRIFDGNGSF